MVLKVSLTLLAMQTATIAAILPGQHAVFEFPGVIENNQPVSNGHTAQQLILTLSALAASLRT